MEPRGFIRLTIEYRQEDRCWTARCPELGTSMFGDTFEEAQEAIIEAINLHLEGLTEAGELEQFLKRHSIKVYRVKPSRKQIVKVPVADNTTYQTLLQPVCA